MEIENKVRSVLESQLGLDAHHITPEKKLADDLGCDSLDTVEIVMGCEEECEVEISDEEAEKLNLPSCTVADVIAIVGRAPKREQQY